MQKLLPQHYCSEVSIRGHNEKVDVKTVKGLHLERQEYEISSNEIDVTNGVVTNNQISFALKHRVHKTIVWSSLPQLMT